MGEIGVIAQASIKAVELPSNISNITVGHWVRVEQPVHFIEGDNELILLSETVGLQNYGAFLEKDGAGLRGHVKLIGLKNGELDLSKSLWTYQIHHKKEGEERRPADERKQRERALDWRKKLNSHSTWDPAQGYGTLGYRICYLNLAYHYGLLAKEFIWPTMMGHGLADLIGLLAKRDVIWAEPCGLLARGVWVSLPFWFAG
ncbi:hypothetical protein Taro_012737 [Colocasia esculenta]|uniref:Uncharacterized protein n=1 Tax=Colocasia esculenta TaxID=4460 RepID=A0A843UA07_COLES|nr:hypothetical protein [Colocasia esculenta]